MRGALKILFILNYCVIGYSQRVFKGRFDPQIPSKTVIEMTLPELETTFMDDPGLEFYI